MKVWAIWPVTELENEGINKLLKELLRGFLMCRVLVHDTVSTGGFGLGTSAKKSPNVTRVLVHVRRRPK